MIRLDLDQKLLVSPGATVKVSDFSTEYSAGLADKQQAAEELASNIEMMRMLQDKLYAHNRYSVLILFQAMDAAGKDGTIKNVMSGVNPQGTQVVSFKTPSAEELDHDYMWRIYKRLPERGMIGIFNRSYYEEALVVRVHPEFLLKQQLPDVQDPMHVDEAFWQTRFRQINSFERHLHENGTVILKFFLNVSKEEQKKRFMRRIEDPSRNWKFSKSDVEERQHWDKYMHAYSELLSNTSTDYAPWYVIPADKKWFMRMAVSNIIMNKLNELPLHYPKMSQEDLDRLEDARKRLEKEK
ncbi:polyphosphate kinase 2 family protein [Alkaliflexus imshenetskii]|uniref:polyphosphate kinase 2 family protein n=1 Tax=Alkaliflexus imshenetskii TaxID=286730 RepID=UPI0004B6BD1E|nr:polyphosphate kinase 2 family protein [Alkaliflexus imshenetskii]